MLYRGMSRPSLNGLWYYYTCFHPNLRTSEQFAFIDQHGSLHHDICKSACDKCVGCHAVVWRTVGRRNSHFEYKRACRCKNKSRQKHMSEYLLQRKRLGNTYIVHNPIIGDDFSWVENEKQP